MEIARLNPEIEVHIVDATNLLQVAEKRILEEYDCQNIKFIDIDSIYDFFDTYYDIVFLDATIEEYSVIDNINRLREINTMLKKGGRLIIHQQLINDCRTKPIASTFNSLTLLLNTPSGCAYTYSDV